MTQNIEFQCGSLGNKLKNMPVYLTYVTDTFLKFHFFGELTNFPVDIYY
jgi:hypothetical protein